MTRKKLLTVFILFLLAAIVASVAVAMYLRSIDIHRAALYGDIEKVERILSKKPELLEARDKLCYTPLHWAASMGYQNMAEILLAKGADVNATSDFGITPLHLAAGRYDDFKTISKSDGEGQRYSILYEKTKIVPPKAMVEFLIASGADVNAKDHRSETPMHEAASTGNVDVAEILIANGAEVNAKSVYHGLTPLHTAAYSGQEEVVKILIDNGAEVNTKTLIEGNTPLHRAVSCGENAESVCKALLERGADVNARNSAGSTPLQQALNYNEAKVAALLRKHGGVE